MVAVLNCCNDTYWIKTPQSIEDADNRDVFEEIIPNTAYEYQKKRAELWARFRYYGIGSCDVDYWVQCMSDRYALIEETWDTKIKAWNAYQTRITGNGIDLSASSFESQTVVSREDTPDNPAGTTIYLSDRTTTDYSGKNYQDLESQTVDDYIKAIPDPWDGFTSQFLRYFAIIM